MRLAQAGSQRLDVAELKIFELHETYLINQTSSGPEDHDDH